MQHIIELYNVYKLWYNQRVLTKVNCMNRAIKFKLKNGKVVTIRRIRGTDADAVIKFLDKFAHDPGAKYTSYYPNQQKKNKESCIELYDDPNNFFLGAWDDDEIIGESTVQKLHPHNPKYRGLTGLTGSIILNKYTSQGLGGKMKTMVEKWARENGVHRFETGVYYKNIRSLNNLLKHGYIIIGIMHDVAVVDNEYMHMYKLEKILD